jgi:tetratricopeptide (TPR) repeat protein
VKGTAAWGRALAGAAVLAGGLAGTAALLGAAEAARRPVSGPDPRLLYLRTAQAADRAFLSFDALAADVYWLRAIQHYGRDRRSTRVTGRFELLEPLLDVTTSLDPHFLVAYRFGAIFLALDPPNGPGRPDQAIALLEKGRAANPTRWQLPYDIGFVHYWHTGDFATASNWFEQAAGVPGAPRWIGALAATTRAQGGNRAGARQLLNELLEADEPYVRASAERGLRQLKALDAIDELQALVEAYRVSHGRRPPDLQAVVGGTPADHTGAPFLLNGDTGKVELSAGSSLHPLPRAIK